MWQINAEKINGSISLDDENNDSLKWWDQIELVKLILASNKIKYIPKEIKQLFSLVVLDVKFKILYFY